SAAHDAYMAALKINPHNLLAAARLKALPTDSVFVPQMQGAPVPTGAPALPALSQVHDANVNNLSNFAYALRNHMMLQKNTVQNAEDQAHDVITSMGRTPPRESLVTAGIGGPNMGIGGAMSSSGGTSTEGLSDSVASTLAKARAAVAQATG